MQETRSETQTKAVPALQAFIEAVIRNKMLREYHVANRVRKYCNAGWAKRRRLARNAMIFFVVNKKIRNGGESVAKS